MMSSSINGFYAVYLSGKGGPGFAMFLLRNGQIGGAESEHDFSVDASMITDDELAQPTGRPELALCCVGAQREGG